MSSSTEPTLDATSEGLRLPGRWRGTEWLPFDEVERLDGTQLVLLSGARRRLPEEFRSDARRALAPPRATGDRTGDAQALGAYVAGPWSPLRAAYTLLSMAERAGASDLHIEAEPEGWRARLRLTGELEPFVLLLPPTGRRLVAALKHLARCLPYRSDVVQEGRIPRDGVAADVRASFLPTATGERVALRLFGRLRALDELGLTADVLAALRGLLDHPSGLVLVAGPSGGGKTTTVYAALAHLAARRGGAHLSIEDPVEQRLRVAGVPVDQVELAPERGLTAEVALVGALRQDVDVIALSEVRTPAEARLAVHAAHTGRLVVAGLHAGSAAEARQRLLDLGVEEAVLATTLRGVLHQRLRAAACAGDCGADCPRCAGTGRVRVVQTSLWQAPEVQA